MSELPEATRELVLAAIDRREEVVDVPEWGCRVRLVQPVGLDAVELSRTIENGELDYVEKAARVLSITIRDREGARLFTPEDLAGKAPHVLVRLQAVAYRVSRVLDEGVRRALGESSGDPSGASTSGSASPSESPIPTSSSPG